MAVREDREEVAAKVAMVVVASLLLPAELAATAETAATAAMVELEPMAQIHCLLHQPRPRRDFQPDFDAGRRWWRRPRWRVWAWRRRRTHRQRWCPSPVGIQVVRAHQVRRVLQERPDKQTFNKSLVRRGRLQAPKA